MNSNFARYVAPARVLTSWWRLLLAVLFLTTFVAIGSVAVLVAWALQRAGYAGDGLARSFGQVALDVTALSDPTAVLVMLGTFVAWFVGIWLAVLIFHGRGIRSLWGIGLQGRGLVITVLVISVLVIISFGFSFLVETPKRNLALGTWLSYLPLALPLLLIQVSSEELIFRGYFLQELAMRTSSRLIWWILPSVVFGLLHFQPDKFGSNAWLIVVVTTLMGMILADITVRTGSLIPAIAIHFANNFLAMMLLAMDGTIIGLALFVSEVSAYDEPLVRAYLLQNLAFLALLYTGWLLWQRRAARLQSGMTAPKSASDANAGTS